MRKQTHETAEALGLKAVAANLGVSAPGFKTGVTGLKPPTTTAKGAEKAPTGVAGQGKGGKAGQGSSPVKPAPTVTAGAVAAPPVSTVINATKPKVLGKRETLLSTPDFVEGFNIAKFAVGLDGNRHTWADKVPAPTAVDIKAARALRFAKGVASGAELSVACMLALTGRHISVEGIGTALITLTNGGGGIRQNVIRNLISAGLAGYINPANGEFTGSDKTTFKLPNHYNSGMRACAAIRPTALGLDLIAKALGGIDNVPDYMRYSDVEIAGKGEAAKAAKKAQREAAKAAKAKVPVKRK